VSKCVQCSVPARARRSGLCDAHSSVTITLSIYARVLPHMQLPAVSAMDQLLAELTVAGLSGRDANHHVISQ
jgi:hypothetical protein